MNIDQPGIYKITNLVNQKIYVGQSVNICRRWDQHKRNANNPISVEYNSLLHKAFRKYGLDNFSFDVVELCAKKDLDNKEIYWIKYYDSVNLNKGYNISLGGSGGVKTWSEDDEKLLIQLHNNKHSLREICEVVGRSHDSVAHKIMDLGLSVDNEWTNDEIELLKKMLLDGKTHQEIGQQLGRSKSSICHKASRLNLITKIKWTENDVSTLLKCISDQKSYQEIGILLGRSVPSVQRKLYDLAKQGVLPTVQN